MDVSFGDLLMSSDSTTTVAQRLAAIDVGSNSIRLVVAEVESDGTYRVLDEEREMTRLGKGLGAAGRLSDESMEKSLEAIGKMKAIADGFQVREIRAIATSAVREAGNGRAFCREALRRHHVQIDVISPEEEAELAFQSVLKHFNLDGRPAAVVDIGGGSTEVILSAGSVIDQTHSLPLGAVRLTERCCRSDPLRRKHWKRLRKEIDRAIKRTIGKPPMHAEIMVGSGGTFTTLAQMIQCQRLGQSGPVQGYLMNRADVIHLLDRLRESPLETRRQIPGMNPTRADIIVAGAAIVARLADHLGSHQILINDGGIRDGLVLSMIRELTGGGVAELLQPRDRLEWVRLFATKCRSNERHCEHVARIAGLLFDGLRDAYDLPPFGREILLAAAMLHDIGYVIHHLKHHKHAYHLIMHGELPGFSAREVELIANVARYHRRALPKKSHENFRRLDRDDRRLVRFLSGILRVADGLDRTHSQCVTGLRCEIADGHIRVVLDAGTDPQVEIWDAERKAELFERSFDARVELIWSEDAEKQASLALRPVVAEPDKAMGA
jgi:exopolyphosphatase/guanosine-5'-triphosphate,3'-diphosphate pyrophosphatase